MPQAFVVVLTPRTVVFKDIFLNLNSRILEFSLLDTLLTRSWLLDMCSLPLSAIQVFLKVLLVFFLIKRWIYAFHFYLFIYFSLCWVFVALLRLPLVVARGLLIAVASLVGHRL